MKPTQFRGILLAALLAGQACFAWGAIESTVPANKQALKENTVKKASKQKVKPTTVVSASSQETRPVANAVTVVTPAKASGNPYLPAAHAPAQAPVANTSSNPYLAGTPVYGPTNPYLAYAQPTQQTNPFGVVGDSISKVGSALPSFGNSEESLLPSIKKVYPTGEKPLVVVTFKCPIEMAGVKGGPTKILHDVVDLGMGAVNSTNLLSFNLQQVCQ
jgi:hypothetical protein